MHRGILPLLLTKEGEGRGEEGRFLFGFPSPQPSPHSFLAGRGRGPAAAMRLVQWQCPRSLSTNRRWADPKCPMSNEQLAKWKMWRLLHDFDFSLLITHFLR